VSQAIPWSLAGRVAGKVAGTHPLAETYHRHHLLATLEPAVAEATALVGVETGLVSPGAAQVLVVSRKQWAERNLAGFSRLLAPLQEQIGERISDRNPSMANAARSLVAVETGALLGVLARRVLGQYELVLPTGKEADTVAFVGANILELERRHQFRPSEFRLWIALHEVTHRAQFVGVPWLRPYFLALVEELVAHARPEPGRLAMRVAELVDSLRRGQPVLDETGLLGLFASPAQREVLDRVQALMSLLEGHGHMVMNRVGERVLHSQARMAEVLRLRRADRRTAAFFRLTGLEMKLRQYEMGDRFVRNIEDTAGKPTLARVWEGPEWLPTLVEIEHPQQWLQRAA
jgi:coenzyme F420 biosynthesis associated uncharacterized protein